MSLIMAVAWAPLPAFAMGHFVCSVVEDVELPTVRADHKDFITHFTCNVAGGELDGFRVDVSAHWELNGTEGKMLGAVGHAKKGNAAVLYLTREGSMKNVRKAGDPPVNQWDSATATAEVKRATGPVAHLSGKTFTMIAQPMTPGKFFIDAVLVK